MSHLTAQGDQTAASRPALQHQQPPSNISQSYEQNEQDQSDQYTAHHIETIEVVLAILAIEPQLCRHRESRNKLCQERLSLLALSEDDPVYARLLKEQRELFSLCK